MRMSKLWRTAAFRKVASWTFAIAVMCGATANCFATAAEAAVFEGVWMVEANPDLSAERGGRFEFQEYLMIESGTVTASELCKLGFDPTGATFSTDGAGKITWTVTMTSRTQGVLTITGEQGSGGTIVGSILWDRDGKSYRYAYSGKKFIPGAE